MKSFRYKIINDLTNEKYVFHDPDIYQLKKITAEAVEEWLQNFQRFKYNFFKKVCEKKRNKSLFYSQQWF